MLIFSEKYLLIHTTIKDLTQEVEILYTTLETVEKPFFKKLFLPC